MTSIQISSHVMGAEFTSSVPPPLVPPVAPGTEPAEDRTPRQEQNQVARPPEVPARRTPQQVSELASWDQWRDSRHRAGKMARRRPERAEKREHEIQDIRDRERASR